MPQPCPIMSATEWTFGTILVMDTGYARVSTAKQDLDRQIDALRQEGIASKYIYVDKNPDPPPTAPDCTRHWIRPVKAISLSSTRSTGQSSSSCSSVYTSKEQVLDYKSACKHHVR